MAKRPMDRTRRWAPRRRPSRARKRTAPRESDAAAPAEPRTGRAAAEPDEKTGRLGRVGAGWKAISGVVATLGTLVGLLATLGVVGGGGGAPSPGEALASGVKKTVSAHSSRVRVSVTETSRTGAADRGGFVGDGEFDYDTGRGHMRYDLSRYPGTEGLPPVDVVFNGPTVYFHDPGGLGFDKSTPWARVSFTDLKRLEDQAEGGLAAFFERFDDPTEAVRRLARSSSGMRKVGKAPVVGSDWTHYRAVRDPDGRGPALPTTEDAWVDEAGYLRTLETTSSTAESTVKTRTEFDDFGVKVDVDLPPSNRVFDLLR